MESQGSMLGLPCSPINSSKPIPPFPTCYNLGIAPPPHALDVLGIRKPRAACWACHGHQWTAPSPIFHFQLAIIWVAPHPTPHPLDVLGMRKARAACWACPGHQWTAPSPILHFQLAIIWVPPHPPPHPLDVLGIRKARAACLACHGHQWTAPSPIFDFQLAIIWVPPRTLWMFWEYGKLGQHAGPAMATNGQLQAQSFISNLL